MQQALKTSSRLEPKTPAWHQIHTPADDACNNIYTLHLLGAGLADVDDVGEEVVVLSLGHGLTELHRVLEHADEDLQAVQVRVFRRDHLEYGLEHKGRVQQKAQMMRDSSLSLLQSCDSFTDT